MEKLNRYAQERNAQGWYVSRAGFTAEAEVFAARQGLYYSDDMAIHELSLFLQKGRLNDSQRARLVKAKRAGVTIIWLNSPCWSPGAATVRADPDRSGGPLDEFERFRIRFYSRGS